MPLTLVKDCRAVDVHRHHYRRVTAPGQRIIGGIAGTEVQAAFMLSAAKEVIRVQHFARRLCANQGNISLLRCSNDTKATHPCNIRRYTEEPNLHPWPHREGAGPLFEQHHRPRLSFFTGLERR